MPDSCTIEIPRDLGFEVNRLSRDLLLPLERSCIKGPNGLWRLTMKEKLNNHHPQSTEKRIGRTTPGIKFQCTHILPRNAVRDKGNAQFQQSSRVSGYTMRARRSLLL